MSINVEELMVANNVNKNIIRDTEFEPINNEKINQRKINLKEIGYLTVRRIASFIGGLVGCIILIPTTLILWIARKICHEDDGPIFYEQLRIGKNGKEFKMYKYRSMCLNADEELEKYLKENKEAREEYKKYKKLKNDPRITKVGEFIRKTSIDELPQLINCLKGDMDLVSVRPYLHREIKDMGENYWTIIKVKPGITGYWQVNGRSSTDFKTRLQMDVEYINSRTLWGDFKYLVKTFSRVIKREGAR